ncbi:hypothetical protein A3A93_04825 [Candidatus Roizmanbacteria bacterium RIFCSPLOWO2_01_FULL_38_12]|uniref:Prepilin type IV endopeptidase peptidase domain-containing protein n=1 Tax=Candidatus Roizmanbacteria bacterium RIFCSPLOWO2_01_FULL_38_12 TaxID=1802061 RepID=A0A1F7IW05_9BACT|nr:MAG: hypothetical protein A3F59_06075 [Candidatus Roizmanbacteria bacterium RIFCSPHIGHO2_12_FULL_38_13]OGK47532.1 MAG: hypothetical protein A3A93_04825 [Candidatus Roizmanbacteria bacterium RIFCSPLOWO2_01_FULL_38_12]
MIDLPTYIFLSIAYFLTMHMALSKTREFDFFEGFTLFAIGGMIGAAVDSYITGFVFAAVMHFIFWNKGSD